MPASDLEDLRRQAKATLARASQNGKLAAMLRTIAEKSNSDASSGGERPLLRGSGRGGALRRRKVPAAAMAAPKEEDSRDLEDLLRELGEAPAAATPAKAKRKAAKAAAAAKAVGAGAAGGGSAAGGAAEACASACGTGAADATLIENVVAVPEAAAEEPRNPEELRASVDAEESGAEDEQASCRHEEEKAEDHEELPACVAEEEEEEGAEDEEAISPAVEQEEADDHEASASATAPRTHPKQRLIPPAPRRLPPLPPVQDGEPTSVRASASGAPCSAASRTPGGAVIPPLQCLEPGLCANASLRPEPAASWEMQLWPATPESTPPQSPNASSQQRSLLMGRTADSKLDAVGLAASRGFDDAFVQVVWVPVPAHLVGDVERLLATAAARTTPPHYAGAVHYSGAAQPESCGAAPLCGDARQFGVAAVPPLGVVSAPFCSTPPACCVP